MQFTMRKDTQLLAYQYLLSLSFNGEIYFSINDITVTRSLKLENWHISSMHKN